MFTDDPAELPAGVVAWLQSEGVDPRVALTPGPWRFFRVAGPFLSSAADGALAAAVGLDLNCVCERVGWLPSGHTGSLRFFRLPAGAPLVQCIAAREGLIQGMDAASGAAVAALGVRPGDRVLDLCCSPGAKLLALLDACGPRGGVDGVDSCAARMATCRALVEKRLLAAAAARDEAADEAEAPNKNSRAHELRPDACPEAQPQQLLLRAGVAGTGGGACGRVRLIVADGRSFTGVPGRAAAPSPPPPVADAPAAAPCRLVFDSVAWDEERAGRTRPDDGRKRRNKSARAREAKRLKHLAATGSARAEWAFRAAPDDELAEVLGSAVTAPPCGGHHIDGHSIDGLPFDGLYDCVLVDAECSHDGSAGHVRKVLTGHASGHAGGHASGHAGEGKGGGKEKDNGGECGAVRNKDAADSTRASEDNGATDDNADGAFEQPASSSSSSSSSPSSSPSPSPPPPDPGSGPGRLSALLCAEACALLVAKQRALLQAGFDLLRPTPIASAAAMAATAGESRLFRSPEASPEALSPCPALVYSTCSLTRSQNEGVVSWLLRQNPDARLDPIPFAQQAEQRARQQAEPCGGRADLDGLSFDQGGCPWVAGGLPHTLRFGTTGATSGLFVARIIKALV